MSDSYLVHVYESGEVHILGIFNKRYKREPRWNGGCCTMTVTAESINEAVEAARIKASFRLVKEGETVG